MSDDEEAERELVELDLASGIPDVELERDRLGWMGEAEPDLWKR
jgi:hypothetical protein